MLRKLAISFVIASAAFLVTFVVFNIAYIKWAVWRYPHHNSMAGLAAFIYGSYAGFVVAIVAFAITFFRTKSGRL